jgi:hypothetical protein
LARCGDLKRNNKGKEKIERRIFSSKTGGNCLDSHQPQLFNCANKQSASGIMVSSSPLSVRKLPEKDKNEKELFHFVYSMWKVPFVCEKVTISKDCTEEKQN